MPNRDLTVKIDGDPKGFVAATKAATAAAKRMEQALDKQQAKQQAAQKSASLMRGELMSLVAAATALAPAAVAAGAGFVSFGALAAPAIMNVVKAQEEMAERWSGMSTAEKVAASGLRQLIGRYKELAKSVEPETLQAFNAGLGVANSLLPRLAPITKAVAKELTAFANEAEDALNSDRADEFFAFLEREAPGTVRAFGDALGSGVNAAASLTESLMPLATAGLGAIGVLADLVAGLSSLNPELAQAAVLMLALRAPIGGVADALNGVGGKYKEFAAKTAGASKATKLLNLVTAAGPNLYLAAGTALAFFAVKALTAQDATGKLVDRLTVANRATGNNVEGYRQLATALQGELSAALEKGGQAYGNNAKAAANVYTQHTRLRDEIERAQTSMNNITAGADALGQKYGITRDQAIALAGAVGVDLSKGILDSGEITAGTVAKFDRYRMAVEAARNPTAVVSQAWADASNAALSLKDRVDALSTAMDAYFNPALAVLQATNGLRDAVAASDKVLSNSKSTLSDRQGALERQLGALGQMASAEFRQSQSVKNSSAAMLEQVPALLRLAGGSQAGRSAVDGLIASMGGSITRTRAATTVVDQFGNQVKILPSGKVTTIKANTSQANSAISGVRGGLASLRDRVVRVTVAYSSTGRATINGVPSTGAFDRGATGGYVSNGAIRRAGGGPVWGAGTATSDSIPALLSNGEYVINAAATKRHRELLEAINAGKFAAGGMVGGYASGGQVASVPISEFISRFMGKSASRSDLNQAIRGRRDAVDQLLKAERKLAEDRRKNRSARTIADSEARVRKERRDLAAATDKLTLTEGRYRKSKLTAAQKLSYGLTLGIKNTGTFMKNIEKIANAGYGELAQQLLAAGGPEAEAMAASAAKLSASKLKSLNAKVVTASKQQTRLDQLPNILKIKAAQKGGARTVAALMRATGLSEDELAEANAVGRLFEQGGIERYARGGRRPGPGIATRPTILFGEGKAPEAFIPYDRAHRPRAMGLVNQVAADLGMRRGGASTTVFNVTVQGALDPLGTARTIEKTLRTLVRTNGRVPLEL